MAQHGCLLLLRDGIRPKFTAHLNTRPCFCSAQQQHSITPYQKFIMDMKMFIYVTILCFQHLVGSDKVNFFFFFKQLLCKRYEKGLTGHTNCWCGREVWGCPSGNPDYRHCFPLHSHQLKVENLGTSLWVPLRGENLSSLNWISTFNQLARKATKQLCAYGWSLESCCA